MAGKKRHQNQNSSATAAAAAPGKKKHGKKSASDGGEGLFDSASLPYKIFVVVLGKLWGD